MLHLVYFSFFFFFYKMPLCLVVCLLCCFFFFTAGYLISSIHWRHANEDDNASNVFIASYIDTASPRCCCGLS